MFTKLFGNLLVESEDAIGRSSLLPGSIVGAPASGVGGPSMPLMQTKMAIVAPVPVGGSKLTSSGAHL